MVSSKKTIDSKIHKSLGKANRICRGSLLVTAICLLLLISALTLGSMELFYDNTLDSMVLQHHKWLARSAVQMGRSMLSKGRTKCQDLAYVGNSEKLKELFNNKSTIGLSGESLKEHALLGADLEPADEVIVLGDELMAHGDKTQFKPTWDGPGVVYIGGEACAYQEYDPEGRRLLGVKRGIDGTVPVAHRAGEQVVRNNCHIEAGACSLRSRYAGVCGSADDWTYYERLSEVPYNPAIWVLGGVKMIGSQHVYGSSTDVNAVEDGSSIVYGLNAMVNMDEHSGTGTYRRNIYTEYGEHVYEGGEVISSGNNHKRDIFEWDSMTIQSLWDQFFTVSPEDMAKRSDYQFYENQLPLQTDLDDYLKTNNRHQDPFYGKKAVYVKVVKGTSKDWIEQIALRLKNGGKWIVNKIPGVNLATDSMISDRFEYEGKSLYTFGAINDPMLLVINGDASFRNFIMYGVLVVLGDCELTGVKLYGQLIVMGSLTMDGGLISYQREIISVDTKDKQVDTEIFYDPYIIEDIYRKNLGFIGNRI